MAIVDEIYQDNRNYDLDESRNEKTQLNHHPEEAKQEVNKNESQEPGTLPNGFYLVNQKQVANNLNNTLDNKLTSGHKRRPLNFISTPGYNVEPTNVIQTRNRKCESVFSVRSHRSRAAYSEMAYPDHRHTNKHGNKHNNGKHCSHRRAKETHHHHKHRRQSSCSHRHKDHRLYEDECLSADEFTEDMFNKNHRKNRSRSYHTLCDEADHHHKFKYFNEFDNEMSCCIRNRQNRSHRRRHRSCCLNELRYDSGQEDAVDDLYIDQHVNEETGSLCSSIHSLHSSKAAYCKRKHRHRKEFVKIDHPPHDTNEQQIDDDQKQRPKPIIKRSLKNLKLIDQLDCESEPLERERQELDNQSDTSELSYCSHHSRKSSRYSKSCHRSKSRCSKHNSSSRSSRCRHSHHSESYSDLDHIHHERSASRRRRKNSSCESLSDQENADQVNNKFEDATNQEKLYKPTIQSTIQSGQFINQQNQMNKLIQPIEHKHMKTNDQYLFPVQQFSNYAHQYPYDSQRGQNRRLDKMMPKYNTLNYRAPINEQQTIQPNFVITQNNLPNYSTTMTNNYIKPPVHFQPSNQIGLPIVYQQNMNYQMKNNATNPLYLINNSQIRNEHHLVDLSQSSRQQVYQNLQEMKIR